MKAKILFALVCIMLFSSAAYAFTDPAPFAEISADKPLVDTSVNIHVFARDSGFFSGIVSIILKEDGKTIETKNCNGFDECTLDVSVQHLEKGSHTYSVSVRDRGGNVNVESTSVRFIGATPPPLLMFNEQPYAEEGKYVEVTVYVYDFNDKPLNATVSSLPRGATFKYNVFRWIPDFDQAGSYTITFSAIDNKNQRTSKSIRIKVEDANRQASAYVVEPTATNFAINEDSNVLFRLNVTDPDKKMPSIKWLLDGRTVSSSIQFRYKTDFGDAGSHIIIARVEDGDFLQRFIWNVTVMDVNRPPLLRDVKNIEVETGEKVRFTVRAADPDKDYLLYEAVKLPYGAMFDPDTGIFEWLAKDRGTYEALFRVHDSKDYYDSTGVVITVFEEQKTELERYEEAYKKMLEREEERKKQLALLYEQQKHQYQLINYTSSFTPVCDSGYLCYVISYFVR